MYKKVSISLLGLDIFIITYPFWAFLLNRISPALTRCTYRYITGNKCPFCGSTKLIRNIWHGNFENLSSNVPTFIILLYVILNMIFRLIYFKDSKVEKSKKRKKVYILIDILTGGALCIYILCVIISFLLKIM